MKLMIIYGIENLINKKLYIGSTQNYARRISDHQRELNHDRHQNPFLQNVWNKDGKNNFEFKIIATAIDVTREELYEIENDYVTSLHTNNSLFGYNIADPVNLPPSRKGIPCSETHKENIRISRAKNPYHHTEEAKRKIGYASANVTEETKEKRRITTKRHKAWNKGLTTDTDIRINKTFQKLKGRTVWNKGLTNKTDNRLIRSQETNDKHKGFIPWNKGKTNVFSQDTRLNK